jgi:four helix bundle protein
MEIQCYRDLIAWQKAMDFVVMIYEITVQFPRDELYGLTCQLRRSAVSIPSNIAEGHGRQSTREFVHFLSVAYGSLNEAQTQVMLAQRLGFLKADQSAKVLQLSYEVARPINGLSQSLTRKLTPNP